MQLRLVRHTKVNLPPKTCYGQSNVPLMDDWEKESMKIVKKLGVSDNHLVYSSPLSRCLLLAKKISNNVITDDRLKELNFGTWELKPWDKINDAHAEKWMNNYIDTPCPGGESYIDLIIRVKAFLADLLKSKCNEAIIVSHAGVIRTIISLIQNIPPDKSFEIEVAYGQIISLDI